MTTASKMFFQNPNTGTPIVLTLGQTGAVCLFVEGDEPESAQDTKDLERWRSMAEGFLPRGLRGPNGLAAMAAQLKSEGADLS